MERALSRRPDVCSFELPQVRFEPRKSRARSGRTRTRWGWRTSRERRPRRSAYRTKSKGKRYNQESAVCANAVKMVNYLQTLTYYWPYGVDPSGQRPSAHSPVTARGRAACASRHAPEPAGS